MKMNTAGKLSVEERNLALTERIAAALEQIVEKLSNLENKVEELTYEVQSHGNVLADALAQVPEGEYEIPVEIGGCGEGECGGCHG